MTATAENGWELAVERFIAAPPETVWRVMTERMTEWWCPRPWRTEIIEQDWRPGGRCAMTMHGPDGETAPSDGVFLEVVPGKRFVTTDAFNSQWIPQPAFMVGGFEIEPSGHGTRYRAWSRHWDEAAMRQHREMGFIEGWSAVSDQLAALAEAGA
jgi:uncharacterized protein YndB with AHSA1/START domain